MMSVLDETGEAVACFQTSGPAPICMKLDVAKANMTSILHYDGMPLTATKVVDAIRLEAQREAAE